MSETHIKVLENANVAIAAGNYEEFLRFCTEDTEWTFVGDRRLIGKGAVRQWMATTYREPPRFKVDIMIAEDDFVAALGEIALKDDEGKTAHHAFCDVWRFRDGRMAELRAFVVNAAA